MWKRDRQWDGRIGRRSAGKRDDTGDGQECTEACRHDLLAILEASKDRLLFYFGRCNHRFM